MNFQVVITNGIEYLLEENEIKKSDLFISLSKFLNNDWGKLDNEDKKYQDELLKNPKSKFNNSFIGIYSINKNEIWIFREFDYSINSMLITILLPDEY